MLRVADVGLVGLERNGGCSSFMFTERKAENQYISSRQSQIFYHVRRNLVALFSSLPHSWAHANQSILLE